MIESRIKQGIHDKKCKKIYANLNYLLSLWDMNNKTEKKCMKLHKNQLIHLYHKHNLCPFENCGIQSQRKIVLCRQEPKLNGRILQNAQLDSRHAFSAILKLTISQSPNLNFEHDIF